MKSEESINKTNKQNNKGRSSKTKLVLLVFAFLIIAAVIAIPITKALKQAIKEEEHEGYTKFRTSRYFFQVFFPEDWTIEQDINGFLLNDESGLVAKITPEEDSGVEISVYYRAGDNVTIDEAMQSFESYFSQFQFGIEDKRNVESEKCELLAKKFEGEEKSGTLYVATRTMCYYAILVTYSDEAKYENVRTDVNDVIKSFEKVVFED